MRHKYSCLVTVRRSVQKRVHAPNIRALRIFLTEVSPQDRGTKCLFTLFHPGIFCNSLSIDQKIASRNGSSKSQNGIGLYQ